MLQLHLSDQQFYCQLRCNLYWMFESRYHMSILSIWFWSPPCQTELSRLLGIVLMALQYQYYVKYSNQAWIDGVELACRAQHSLVVPFWRPLDGSSIPPFGLGDKSPMITDQHTAGGSVSQLSQLTRLSPWLTLATKDITTSFWHYNKRFGFYVIKSWVYIISVTQ